jgi:hypothetical protein
MPSIDQGIKQIYKNAVCSVKISLYKLIDKNWLAISPQYPVQVVN